MAKYLLLKHYRGGPTPYVDFGPMDQWTPAEVDAHCSTCATSRPSWRARASSWTARRCRRRARSSATTARAGRRSPTARSPRPRT